MKSAVIYAGFFRSLMYSLIGRDMVPLSGIEGTVNDYGLKSHPVVHNPLKDRWLELLIETWGDRCDYQSGVLQEVGGRYMRHFLIFKVNSHNINKDAELQNLVNG